MIRRFRCSGCGRYHNELPDCLVPYKHYEAEAISGVIDGVVTSDDLDSEDYPCVYTMLLWIRWFTGNLERIEGYLRSVAYELSDYDQEVLYSQVPLLESIRHCIPAAIRVLRETALSTAEVAHIFGFLPKAGASFSSHSSSVPPCINCRISV